MTPDRNCLSYWFPLLETAAARPNSALNLPATRITTTTAQLVDILDGKTPKAWDDLITRLAAFGDELGWPCFLRTGHGSGKHDWSRTCFVRSADALPRHVAALIEWSHLVDIMGLPTNVWAVREMISTAPLFICRAYGGFPVTREFRVFVRDAHVHVQPYWPPDACRRGRPDCDDWRAALSVASRLSTRERAHIEGMALEACAAVGGGYWSIDFLQDRHGVWWLTDLADGDQSFRWDPVEFVREPAAGVP